MTGPIPALIMAVGLLLAAAAPAPSGPDALPAQVAGVIGSGDQLSLQLRATADAPARIVHLGEAAIDGWALTGLTDTVATLAKDGQTRAIGLNPTGALASKAPAAPPSQVTIAGEDARLLAQAIARGVWDGQTLQPGLTLEETQRYWTLNERFSEKYKVFATDLEARATKAGIELSGAILRNDTLSVLGPQYAPEFAALSNKMADERDQQSAAALARYGPVTVHVASPSESAAATAPYDQAMWTQTNRAADGSYDLVMSGPTPQRNLRYSMDVAANPPPLDSIQVLATTTPGSNVFTMMPQPPP
ncbi:MAG: hypothetical protein JWM33_2949 [Caulobacteraceae bacterium]|nr:hypothetical protein [Caulobacteraceae bacterium]